jgi:hypothetical protein
MSLEKMEEDLVENQVENLDEFLHQLQQRVAELELQTMLRTSQEVRDQREANS